MHCIFTNYVYYYFGASNTSDSGQFWDIRGHIYKLRQMTWGNYWQIEHNNDARKWCEMIKSRLSGILWYCSIVPTMLYHTIPCTTTTQDTIKRHTMNITWTHQKTHKNTIRRHKMKDHLWLHHWQLVITSIPYTQERNQFRQSCMKFSCMGMTSSSALTSSNASHPHSLPSPLFSLHSTLWWSTTA